jgi:hypothetical protein
MQRKMQRAAPVSQQGGEAGIGAFGGGPDALTGEISLRVDGSSRTTPAVERLRLP